MKILFILLFLVISSSTDSDPLFKETLEKADTESKPILLIFSGSDWCSSCMRLDKEVLTNQSIEQKLRSKYIIHNADFPRTNKQKEAKKRDNEALASQYNPEGKFPHIVVINPNRDAHETYHYQPGKEENLLKSLGIQ